MSDTPTPAAKPEPPKAKRLGLVIVAPGAPMAPHRVPGFAFDLFPHVPVPLDSVGLEVADVERWIRENQPAATVAEFEPGTGRVLREVPVQGSCPVALVDVDSFRWRAADPHETEQRADLTLEQLAAQEAAHGAALERAASETTTGEPSADGGEG